MNLELLPNEIFLDLFDYFNGIDLLCAFYGLNSRFNFLLYKQFRSYCFDFNSVSKRNFDMICQQHLPFIADRVIALSLHEYDDTPEQINLFFSYIPLLNQFTHMQSLTLSNLHSYNTLLKLLDTCHHLNSLTYLKFILCSIQNREADFQLIVNNIWSLPKLTNCYFDISIEARHHFCVPTIISSSLQSLTIFSSILPWNQINRLFDYTPRLQYLWTSFESFIADDYIICPLPTLIKCNFRVYNKFVISILIVFFKSVPNLRHLDVNLCSELINGCQWEEIIRNYLPKLKTFRLKMRKWLLSEQNIEEQADRLIDSFRSSFWIDEHQWFVRCLVWNRSIRLHSLSESVSTYESKLPSSWRSTYPPDNQQEFYDHITSIYNERCFDQVISSQIRLPNIDCLCIKLPINDQFWSIVPSLNRLNTLIVSSHADTFQSQLQTLLDRSPHLHRLSISQDASLPLQISLFKYANTSIRLIHLHDCHHCFNEDECIALTRSPLGVQCEVLWISVNNRKNIIYLVKNMINLRALIVKWENKKYHYRSALTENNDDEFCDEGILNNDELIQWLKYRLPSTYLITKDPKKDSNIIIWI